MHGGYVAIILTILVLLNTRQSAVLQTEPNRTNIHPSIHRKPAIQISIQPTIHSAIHREYMHMYVCVFAAMFIHKYLWDLIVCKI